MKKCIVRTIIAIAVLFSASSRAGGWYNSASFIAAYAELDQLQSIGDPSGRLNATGRADEVVGFGLAIGHDWADSPWRVTM